jgi:rifampicin phosphotransferase
MLRSNAYDNHTLPGKFKYLFQLAETQPVPEMTLITEAQLRSWFSNFDEVKSGISAVENHIAITSGTFITDDLQKIQRYLKSLTWLEDADKDVAIFIKGVLDCSNKFSLAIRSASQLEDLEDHSFAGIYDSVLNVDSIEKVQTAIIEVWSSAYSTKAIMEKLSANLIGSEHEMNIIVQKMLEPTYAGVAFSCDPMTNEPVPYVEYVEGLGEALVSGDAKSKVIKADSLVPDLRNIYQQLKSIMDAAATLLGTHVDIEWAYEEGKVWLLQARAITTYQKATLSLSPVYNLYSLYDDLSTELSTKLPEYAVYFNKKRKPLHDIAKQVGTAEAGAVIVELNGIALDNEETCSTLLSHFHSTRQVVDFSSAVRQLVVDKEDLISHLKDLITDPKNIQFVVIRDFVKGQFGVITREVNKGSDSSLIAEVSEDGLLAMNRGSAVSRIITLDAEEPNEFFDAKNMNILHQVTELAVNELNDVQIEWVLSNGHLYALDYSAVSDANVVISQSGRVMSQGYVRGTVLLMESNTELENYSVAPSMSLTDIPDVDVYGSLFSSIITQIKSLDTPPIIFSKRPYAALASLLPYVSGFVFEKGSLLCHLGVLLREKQLPAVCDEILFNETAHGDAIELDTFANI